MKNVAQPSFRRSGTHWCQLTGVCAQNSFTMFLKHGQITTLYAYFFHVCIYLPFPLVWLLQSASLLHCASKSSRLLIQTSFCHLLILYFSGFQHHTIRESRLSWASSPTSFSLSRLPWSCQTLLLNVELLKTHLPTVSSRLYP